MIGQNGNHGCVGANFIQHGSIQQRQDFFDMLPAIVEIPIGMLRFDDSGVQGQGQIVFFGPTFFLGNEVNRILQQVGRRPKRKGFERLFACLGIEL